MLQMNNCTKPSLVWVVFTKFGWFWVALVGFGWLWVVLVGFGWFWLVLAGCGWLWLFMGGFGWLWLVVGGFGWFWLVACCRFVRFLQYTSELALLACSLHTDLNYVTTMLQLCNNFCGKVGYILIDRYVTPAVLPPVSEPFC